MTRSKPLGLSRVHIEEFAFSWRPLDLSVFPTYWLWSGHLEFWMNDSR
jgi:hypothetical protein